jgi:hypothetical protein
MLPSRCCAHSRCYSPALGLTPRNENFRLHFLSCDRLFITVSVISCPYVGHLFRWEIFLHDSCFSDEFIGCRSNIINFFHIFLAPPCLLMSCSLFENSFYSFHMTVLIHILCNVLIAITVNSLAC